MKLSDLNKPVSMNLGSQCNPEILYHLPIPPALHKFNARLLLGKDWWDDIRMSVYASNNWACFACDDTEGGQLDAHECYDFDFKKRIATCTDIVPLCKRCHSFIHWLASAGMHKQQRDLKHGIQVLLDAKMKVPYKRAQKAGMNLPRRKMFFEWNIPKMAAFYHPGWKLDVSMYELPLEVYPEWSRERLIV